MISCRIRVAECHITPTVWQPGSEPTIQGKPGNTPGELPGVHEHAGLRKARHNRPEGDLKGGFLIIARSHGRQVVKKLHLVGAQFHL